MADIGFNELVEYFTVKWSGFATTQDGPDADDKPDLSEINGFIIFTANVNGPVKFITATNPFDLFPLEKKIKVVNGVILHEGRDYAKLEAASAAGKPSDWNWKVTFDIYTNSKKIEINPFNITAIPGSTVNLTLAMPVAGNTGTPTATGPQGFSIINVELVNGDKLRFVSNDPANPTAATITIPAISAANTSATAAAGSATAAGNSATAAASSAGTASTKAGEAATSATNAGNSATAAAGSAGTASTKATEAGNSATAAAGSATAAAGSASAASGSATTANNAANAANGSATTAGNAAISASQSNTAAGNSATAAAGSAGTASTKATEAAQSAAAALQALADANAMIIPNDAVTNPKIQDGAVTSAKIADGTIVAADIADGTITGVKIADSNIAGSKLSNLAVTAAKMANKTVTATQIADDTITAAQIAADAITASELADNAVDTGAIVAKAVTAAKIADDTITAAQIAANAVGSSELADGAVDTAAILDSNVTLPKLATAAKAGGLNFGIYSDTRKVGQGDGMAPMGYSFPIAFRITKITLDMSTADASGNTVVMPKKNASDFPTSITIAAPATSAASAAYAVDFAIGDKLIFNVTGIGATPGKMLRATIEGYAL